MENITILKDGKKLRQKRNPKLLDIKKQAHYEQHLIQPVVFIAMNNIGYLEGNVIKYVCRYKLKAGITDLKKAAHYLEILIRKEETGEVKP